MDSVVYAALSRQSGLLREMQIVANNIANSATDGYRQEGLIFSEYVHNEGGESLSLSGSRIRNTSHAQGPLSHTGGTLDLALDGDGFFMIQTPKGERLTRAGAFSVNAEGELVTPQGFQVLDVGRQPVFLPNGSQVLRVAGDGTISADGNPLGQVGVFRPTDTNTMTREDGVAFRVDGEIEDVFDRKILQFHVENSNVNAVSQLARMIEIQRNYELGQSLLKSEDERIRAAVRGLTA